MASAATPKQADISCESTARVTNKNLGGEDSMRRSADDLRANQRQDRIAPNRPLQDRGGNGGGKY